jgi:hypothetical protein
MSCAHLVAGEGGVRKLGQTKASCGMAVVLYSGAGVAPDGQYHHAESHRGQYRCALDLIESGYGAATACGYPNP